jgi:hypothetical protein
MRLANLLFCVLVLFLFSNCEKILEKRCDWQIVDPSGNNQVVIRNKTEAELLACRACGISGSGQVGLTLGQMITSCQYYSLCDPKFCWSIGNGYLENTSEKFVNCFFPSAVKVDCNSCGNWFTRIKTTYIPSNSTNYSRVTSKFYCGDTALIFKSGAQFVIKQTTDSLILLQYSKDGTVWN